MNGARYGWEKTMALYSGDRDKYLRLPECMELCIVMSCHVYVYIYICLYIYIIYIIVKTYIKTYTVPITYIYISHDDT